ncbi:PRC-barrel domain-containing protein, partial [Cribrihabitans sp. XS_ASV171]
VNVEQSGEADVEVTQAEPKVRIEGVEGADVDIEQAKARIEMVDYDTDEQGNLVSEEDREAYAETMEQNPFRDVTVRDMIGMNVMGENREDVGEIDDVGVRGETVVAIVGVGGFLGMGEHSVAIPVDQLALVDGMIILPMGAEEVEEMPEYETAEFEPGQRDAVIGDYVRFDG